MKIKDVVVPTYTPSSQGTVERVVRTIKEGIDTTLIDYEESVVNIDWPMLLDACLFNANTVERFNGYSRFEVMLGRKPISPLTAMFGENVELLQNEDIDEFVGQFKFKLKEIHDYWASKSFELKHKVADGVCKGHFDLFEINDVCVRVAYVSGRRLVLGKVQVIAKLADNTYEVTSESGNSIVHGYQLIKVPEHPDRTDIVVVPPAERYYEIESIIRYEPNKGYLVRWKNFDSAHDSWQLPRDMPAAFRKEMRIARGRARVRV